MTTDNQDFDEAERINMMGVGLMGIGNYEEAISRFSEAIQHDSTRDKFYSNRGLAYKWIGKLDQARADLERALRLNPDPEGAFVIHTNLGLVWAEREDYEQAIREYGKAIRFNSSAFQPYFNRAVAYSMRGNREAMIADAKMVLELEPDMHDRISLLLGEDFPD